MKSENQNSLFVQLKNFGIGPIIGMVISIVTVPVTTRIVSPEEFGKSSLFSLVQAIFNLVVLLGLDQSYVRFYNQKTIDKQNLLYNCLFIPTVFCFFIICLTILLKRHISIFMFGTYEPIIMTSFMFFFPALLINRFALLSIRMDLRGKTYSFLNVFQHIVNFIVLIFLLFFYEKTFRSIVFATICSIIINAFLSVILSRQFFPIKRIHIDAKLLKELLKFGLPLLPATVFTWIMNSFDKIALRTFSSFEELGLYAAAFKIVSPLNIIQTIFTTTWIPLAYRWYEEKVSNKKFEQISTMMLAFMVIVFSLIIIFKDIIMLLLGSEYRNTSNIFVFLLFSPIMYTVSETTALGIAFSKKTIYQLLISILAAGINIIGNYLLVPVYGAQGAAISTCICYLVFFWSRTLFSRRLWFRFDISKYFVNIILLLCFAINMLLWNNNIIQLILFFIVLLYNGLLLYKIYNGKKKEKMSFQ